MLPAGDGSEDAIGVGGSDEGLGMFFVLGDVAVDGGLEIDERAEDPTRDAASGAAAGKDAPRNRQCRPKYFADAAQGQTGAVPVIPCRARAAAAAVAIASPLSLERFATSPAVRGKTR